MKFSAAQLEFLMTKMTIDDSFIEEAKTFVSSTVKPKTEKVCCSAMKKDGNQCKNTAKNGDFCGRHSPKVVLSDEVVEDDSE
jgi:hypothetical protein